MAFDLSFHHYGLAVRNPELAQRFLATLGYRIGAPVHDPLQRVTLHWCVSDSAPAVEVVSPAESPGPLDSILTGHSALVYHLCFETTHIEPSLNAIRDDGHRVLVVSSPKPAILFDNRKVGFYMIKGFGLIELLER